MKMQQVWCVAYDDETPYMDGPRRHRVGEWKTREQAEESLEVLRSRSARAPKINLTIETRWVSAWEEEVSDADS